MHNKVVAALIGIVVAAGLMYFGYSYNPSLKNISFQSSQSVGTVSMLIDNGREITGYKNLTIPADASVFGLLQNVTASNNITLDFDPASSNSFNSVFIKQIDGRVNGEFGSFWQYWVDGEQPQVGADKYVLKGGETVLWTFRPSEL